MKKILAILLCLLSSTGCAIITAENAQGDKTKIVSFFNKSALEGFKAGNSTKTTSTLLSIKNTETETQTEAVKAIFEGITSGAVQGAIKGAK